MKKILKTVWKQLPLLLLILAILFSWYTGYYFTYNFLDSDASSELVLGKLLADQNKIVTKDFAYPSELRLFNLNLIHMPLFEIFSKWRTVRYLGMIILQLMLLGSYYYLSRQMKISKRAFSLSAALMLLPVSLLYGRFALYQQYYTPALIFSFLIAGLFLSFIRHQGRQKIPQALRLLAMLALAFASCLNGFRQFPSIMIPLFLTALVVAVKSHRGAPDSLVSVPKRHWLHTFLAAAVFAVGMAGLLIHTRVLPNFYSFILKDNSIVKLPTVENLRALLVGYLGLFGFQEGRALFSTEGLLALGGVFAAVVFLIVSLGDIIPRTKPERPLASFMGTFYPVALLSMTANFLLIAGNENYTQYYVTVFIWFFPYLGYLLDQTGLSLKSINAKRALVWLACLCMAANGVFYNLYILHPDGKQVRYDTIIVYDTAPSLRNVTRFLVDNDYEVGYATFWLTHVITEMTDGKIPMVRIFYDIWDDCVRYEDILTSRLTREKSFVDGKKVFLILADYELPSFMNTQLYERAAEIYRDDNYHVFGFESGALVWDYLLEQAVLLNQRFVLDPLIQEGAVEP